MQSEAQEAEFRRLFGELSEEERDRVFALERKCALAAQTRPARVPPPEGRPGSGAFEGAQERQ